MEYRGYKTTMHYDEVDKIYHGKIEGIVHLVSFHGETEHEFKAAFHEAVDDYIEAFKCVE